jgi:hypothetical protein
MDLKDHKRVLQLLLSEQQQLREQLEEVGQDLHVIMFSHEIKKS